jgi:hypothetical protein
MCKNINNFTAMIYLENLNPRSKSLKGNLEELRYVFTSDELREKLNVFFLHLEHQQRLGV